MAFEPFPSKRNDPAWSDFTAAHSAATAELQLPATPVETVVAPVQPVPVLPLQHALQSPIYNPLTGKPIGLEARTRGDEIPHVILRKGVGWRVRLSTPLAVNAIVSVVPATLVTWLANEVADGSAATQWGAGLVLVSAACAALGTYMLSNGTATRAAGALLAASVMLVMPVIVASTGDWRSDLVAWLIMTGATAAAATAVTMRSAMDRAKVREVNAKTDVQRAKAALQDQKALTEQLKQSQMVAAMMARAAVAPEYQPYLGGATQEERDLRHAFWTCLGAELPRCDVADTATGWVATVALPPSLNRNAARAAWDKVASCLAADGRFILADGGRTNVLSIRYVDSAAFVSDTMWYPGRPGIGVCTVTAEIVDVPVEGAHSMTGGRTNMGKSAYARIQLMRTCADPKRAGVVIDPKRAEAVAWKGKLRVAGASADLDARNDEIYDTLCELMAEFRHRQTLFPGLYWEASEEYPTLFITIDEGAALKRMSEIVGKDIDGKNYKPYGDALDMAETLYGEARVVGMYLNWASQYLAKGTSIPQLVKENVGAVIGLTTAGAEGDRMLFGEEAGQQGWSPSKHCAGVPGRAMVKYRDREAYPVQLWHVTGEHIAALPDVEPWRSRAYRQAPGRPVAAPQTVFDGDPREEAQHLRDTGKSLADVAAAVGKSKSWVAKYTEAE